jgi:hypothetical protein
LSKEERSADEEFDISILTSIELDIVKYMSRDYIPDEHIASLVEIYREGSKFYDLPSKSKVIPDTLSHVGSSVSRMSLIDQPQSDIVVVQRERFAKASLQLLFNCCSVQSSILSMSLIFRSRRTSTNENRESSCTISG